MSKKACCEGGGYEVYAGIKAIINDLWYACQNCDRDPDILREKWASLIYPIMDIGWNFLRHFHQCDHPPLVEDEPRKKKWPTTDSPAHFKERHSGSKHHRCHKETSNGCPGLESFHSLINKYSPNWQSFSHKGMIVCTELAVLDHNDNLEKEQATTADGTPRFNVVLSKRTKHWFSLMTHT